MATHSSILAWRLPGIALITDKESFKSRTIILLIIPDKFNSNLIYILYYLVHIQSSTFVLKSFFFFGPCFECLFSFTLKYFVYLLSELVYDFGICLLCFVQSYLGYLRTS